MRRATYRRIERAFIRSLNGLINQIVVGIGNESNTDTIARKLKNLSNSRDFQNAAIEKTLLMVTQVKRETDKSWREAARKAGKGNDLYNSIINSLDTDPASFYKVILNNASYITKLPLDISEWIVQAVEKDGLKGVRSSDITTIILKKIPEMSKNRAKLIARTEVSKTQTALVQRQSERLGLNWYIWRSSKDSRVRSSHDHMDGVLVNWDDPPSPETIFPNRSQKPYGKYHAGNTFNCRCYPEPIVSIDFIQFPCKVYHNGKITTMSKNQFLNVS